jgi:hypothetical protein
LVFSYVEAVFMTWGLDFFSTESDAKAKHHLTHYNTPMGKNQPPLVERLEPSKGNAQRAQNDGWQRRQSLPPASGGSPDAVRPERSESGLTANPVIPSLPREVLPQRGKPPTGGFYSLFFVSEGKIFVSERLWKTRARYLLLAKLHLESAGLASGLLMLASKGLLSLS